MPLCVHELRGGCPHLFNSWTSSMNEVSRISSLKALTNILSMHARSKPWNNPLQASSRLLSWSRVGRQSWRVTIAGQKREVATVRHKVGSVTSITEADEADEVAVETSRDIRRAIWDVRSTCGFPELDRHVHSATDTADIVAQTQTRETRLMPRSSAAKTIRLLRSTE